MKKQLLVLVLSLMTTVASAQAGTATLTWTNATLNTDGSTIPASGAGSLTRTTVDYGTCGTGGAFGTKQGEMFVAPPATTLTVNMVVVQQYCFRAWHTNTFAVASNFSNVATKNNPAPTPNPPGTLVVTNPTAWGIIQSDDRVAHVRVGTIPLGTVCDTSQHVLGRFVVPRSSVTFTGSVQPRVIVADCG